MLILKRHFDKTANKCILPIGPEGSFGYRDFTPSEIQLEWQKRRKQFNGVFDGADVGIYYFGTDPRNARGKSFLQRDVPSEYGDAKKWKLGYSHERRFIDFISEGVHTPLFCIHITSKQLRMFLIHPPVRLMEQRIKGLNQENSKIYIRVSVIQIVKAIKRRMKFGRKLGV
jgi:hypothetical protein